MTETVLIAGTSVCSYGLGLHGTNKVLILTVRLNLTRVVKVSRYQPMEPFSPLAQNGMAETVIKVDTPVCSHGLVLYGIN